MNKRSKNFSRGRPPHSMSMLYRFEVKLGSR